MNVQQMLEILIKLPRDAEVKVSVKGPYPQGSGNGILENIVKIETTDPFERGFITIELAR